MAETRRFLNLPNEITCIILSFCDAVDIVNFSVATGLVHQVGTAVRRVSLANKGHVLQDQHVVQLISRFYMYIEYFDVSHCYWLKSKSLQGLPRCTNLKTLLAVDAPLMPSIICSILTRCKHLETLSLSGLLPDILPVPVSAAVAEQLGRLTCLTMLVSGAGPHSSAKHLAVGFAGWLSTICRTHASSKSSGHSAADRPRLQSLTILADWLGGKARDTYLLGQIATLTGIGRRLLQGVQPRAEHAFSLLPRLLHLDVRELRQPESLNAAAGDFGSFRMHGGQEVGEKFDTVPRQVTLLRCSASHASGHAGHPVNCAMRSAHGVVMNDDNVKNFRLWCRPESLVYLDVSGCCPSNGQETLGVLLGELRSLRHLRLNASFLVQSSLHSALPARCENLQSLSVCRSHDESCDLPDLFANIVQSCTAEMIALDLSGLSCCSILKNTDALINLRDRFKSMTHLRYLGLPTCFLVPHVQKSLEDDSVMSPLSFIGSSLPSVVALQLRTAYKSCLTNCDCATLTRSRLLAIRAADDLSLRCGGHMATPGRLSAGSKLLGGLQHLSIHRVPGQGGESFVGDLCASINSSDLRSLSLFFSSSIVNRFAFSLWHLLGSMQRLEDLRLEAPEMPLFRQLVISLGNCSCLRRVCLAFAYVDIAIVDLMVLIGKCSMLTVLQLFTGSGTHAAFREMTKKIVEKYTPERPGLSVSLVRTGARHDKSFIGDQLERVPIQHYVELTSCEVGLMDLFERERELY